MAEVTNSTPEERASKRAEDLTGVLWHLATYIIINGFLWAIDILQGGGVNWAFWVSIGWGIGLAFHIAWYVIDVAGRGRAYQRFLTEEQAKDTGTDRDDSEPAPDIG